MKINSLSELESFAREFAAALRAPQAVLLSGPLGAGKTEFVRFAIRELCGADTIVPSPTFNIVQTYDSPRGRIAHFDLYRVESSDELAELGLADYLANSIVFIEWPEKAAGLVKNGIKILIENPIGDAREITVIP
ncbi:MAG: tRNA (adenosine(37)-N6)-threonylcarbamoyltransferase complex ATPase subunit type 1 TsaE [Rickettsiales bacterium]|jgi:tRNA threonylcarbamoyl adenosine modification protein YjeE|nr:tRNA (adenosine(37)-N6)-threonylcarbamoyltransferase complex ATPase subunit type 1 TsaE [Rickettsiales bacterium]